ncbi:hypothetical protein LIER_29210 [Lithospermum erythrorhizon]|uniref:Amino acid transporter transmembrane domain-containing protein n=1 Tax=Lithospermum erythrorhizon TaxID=34254 RepID=A0AAV3RLN5_LITER
MKNSESEQCFFMENDDDEYAEENGDEFEDDSDSLNEEDDNQSPQQKPSILNPTWPQSYRQSIDIYSSVPSPGGILGTPVLSRLGSSFFGSSLTRRYTPDNLAPLHKPLLPQQVVDDHVSKQDKRSHSSYRSPSRKSSLAAIDHKPKISHELPMSHQSSYGQAVLNGTNVLCGVGLLTTPYAVKEGGWSGIAILFVFAVLSFYTGLLLRSCLDSQPGLETYPDVGQAAFGNVGRFAISIILYVELYASCVEYLILEGDNLSSLFPNVQLNLGGFVLDGRHFFAFIATLVVLPTVWLRDLSVLSYLSAGGVIASILVVLTLFWVGLVDDVNIHAKGKTLNLSTLPVAVGLYGFCYSGHAVFPNIYTSMEDRRKFPAVLLTCFGMCTLMYAGTATMGYRMFGEATQSQFTLNLPQHLVASKFAVWTTVINPLSKYALTISPVAMSLEELLPPHYADSHLYAILIRSVLAISTLLVGLSIPFFGLVMALIGSLLTMLITFILPCVCFLKILKGKVTTLQATFCALIIAVGVVSSSLGTYSAISQIVESLYSQIITTKMMIVSDPIRQARLIEKSTSIVGSVAIILMRIHTSWSSAVHLNMSIFLDDLTVETTELGGGGGRRRQRRGCTTDAMV